MLRTALARSLLLLALAPVATAAQVVDDEPLPGGSVLLSVVTSFTGWDERFGTDGRVPLGSSLTGADALALHSGAGALTGALRTLSGSPDYAPSLGPAEGRVWQDATRLELGLRFAPFDWLTLGAVVPRVKTRSHVDLVFVADTLGSDLGLHPAIGDPSAVDAFLGALGSASGAAAGRADALCAGADPACTEARALADRAAALETAAREAYGATPFFPYRDTPAALAITSTFLTLDADLRAAGLDGLVSGPVFSSVPVTEEALAQLAQDEAYGYGGALASRTSLWGWGDVELSATARLLAVGADDAERGGASATVFGGVLLRLGTGHAADPDLPFALGSGDGQTDVEGRLAVRAGLSSLLGVRASVRHGRQGARTLVRRVAPPTDPLAPASTRAELRWRPGDYTAIEAEPTLRLTPELGLAGVYRWRRKAADDYELVASGSGAPDPVVLEDASRATLHEVGLALVYDTTRRWDEDPDVLPVRLQGRLLRAVAGSGGWVPAPVRVELGLQVAVGVPGLR